MILDEATTNLDAITEQKLLQSLEPYMADRTMIIISHRLRKWEGVEQMIGLENGRLSVTPVTLI